MRQLCEHEVVVVGAGPTGLMLAAELSLAGVDAAVIERRGGQEVVGSRAGGLHSRTIEILDQRGVAERFLAAGYTAQVAGFGQIRLDISDFPTRHPYGLALWQSHIERILAQWVDELGVPVHRGCDVIGVAQDENRVQVVLAGGDAIGGRYAVGCDGGRSVVRRSAGIAFDGWDATTSYLIAEVEVGQEPPWGIRHDAIGIHGLSRLDDGPVRVMVTERELGSGVATLDDLRAGLVSVYGSDFGVHSPTSVSRFTDMARQATAYRAGRILLAGDAAHVHHPVGGQGLNTGVQDAVNLGWKLGQVVRGVSPDRLLDTYHDERHPVGAAVLRNTLAQRLLLRPDDRSQALRETMTDLLAMTEPRTRLAARMSGLDIRYDLGEGHPLLGRRMPDLDLQTAAGPVRMFALLHTARSVLLNLGPAGRFAAIADAHRLHILDAEYVGAWELPGIGAVPAAEAVLVRPDGHVAWVGAETDTALGESLATWCGVG
ncbi:FAD-dependent monooxygenase [Mycobacterium sp. M26]|uniref:FAD-dependent monooxygenase n=1 Tax=Mycobacterium sp. M26 TaxID=1762962 RepID=UPI00073E376B|nr:FAD-dependent monooxygenase [Mycobacterium sp. M26]